MSENDVVQDQVTHAIVRDAMVAYGTYVIEDRVVADARDGLKPVQRRLLWTLWEEKATSKAVPSKCALIIGAATGRYHPHGDAAAYQALVHLSWLRSPLVEQHGNFGSPFGLVPAKAAAFRYTETRLTKLADTFFEDIHVAPMGYNYNETFQEPEWLPTPFPLLLVNGSQGLAPGLFASLPPHHLGEVLQATKHALRHPDCTTADLLRFVKGPDYGRGVLLSSKADLRKLYETGQGKLTYTCQYHYEDGAKKDIRRLVITGFAPGFKPSTFEAETVTLQQQKLLVKAAYDDGSKEQPTRIVLEFKDPLVIRDRVLPKLETSVTYRMYALDSNKQVRIWPLKDLLLEWIAARRQVDTAVLAARADDLRKRIGTEEARLSAIINLKILLKVLAKSKNLAALQQAVVRYLKVAEWQAEIILKMPVASLRRASKGEVGKRIDALKDELSTVLTQLKDVDSVVEKHLDSMLSFADKRGTRLRKGGEEDLDSDVTYWVAALPDGRVERFDKPPLKSRAAWNYVGLELSKDTVVTVTDRNVGQSVNVTSLDKLARDNGTVVGMATGFHAVVVVITRRGKYVAFAPAQKRQSFPVMRLEEGDAIIAAVGIREADNVLVRRENGALFRLGFSKGEGCQAIAITRPNTKPKNIRGKGTVTHVWVEGHEEELHAGGRDLYDARRVKDPTKVRRFGQKNLVIIDSKRQVMSLKGARRAVAENPGTIVVPLPKDE